MAPILVTTGGSRGPTGPAGSSWDNVYDPEDYTALPEIVEVDTSIAGGSGTSTMTQTNGNWTGIARTGGSAITLTASDSGIKGTLSAGNRTGGYIKFTYTAGQTNWGEYQYMLVDFQWSTNGGDIEQSAMEFRVSSGTDLSTEGNILGRSKLKRGQGDTWLPVVIRISDPSVVQSFGLYNRAYEAYTNASTHNTDYFIRNVRRMKQPKWIRALETSSSNSLVVIPPAYSDATADPSFFPSTTGRNFIDMRSAQVVSTLNGGKKNSRAYLIDHTGVTGVDWQWQQLFDNLEDDEVLECSPDAIFNLTNTHTSDGRSIAMVGVNGLDWYPNGARFVHKSDAQDLSLIEITGKSKRIRIHSRLNVIGHSELREAAFSGIATSDTAYWTDVTGGTAATTNYATGSTRTLTQNIFDGSSSSSTVFTDNNGTFVSDGVLAGDVILNLTRKNTAQAGGATTITLDTGASAVNDTYNGMIIDIVSGTGSGQTKTISDYDGASRVATVTTWTTNPDNTSGFEIHNNGIAMVTAVTQTTITSRALSTGSHSTGESLRVYSKSNVYRKVAGRGNSMHSGVAAHGRNELWLLRHDTTLGLATGTTDTTTANPFGTGGDVEVYWQTEPLDLTALYRHRKLTDSQHTGATHATILTTVSGTFAVDGVVIGDKVINISDRNSTGVVTAVGSGGANKLTVGGLVGGTNNTFTAGDYVVVSPSSLDAIETEANIHGGHSSVNSSYSSYWNNPFATPFDDGVTTGMWLRNCTDKSEGIINSVGLGKLNLGVTEHEGGNDSSTATRSSGTWAGNLVEVGCWAYNTTRDPDLVNPLYISSVDSPSGSFTALLNGGATALWNTGDGIAVYDNRVGVTQTSGTPGAFYGGSGNNFDSGDVIEIFDKMPTTARIGSTYYDAKKLALSATPTAYTFEAPISAKLPTYFTYLTVRVMNNTGAEIGVFYNDDICHNRCRYRADTEFERGLYITDATDVRVDDFHAESIGGDLWSVQGSNCSDIWFTKCSGYSISRQGIAPVGGSDIHVLDNDITFWSRSLLDLEPPGGQLRKMYVVNFTADGFMSNAEPGGTRGIIAAANWERLFDIHIDGLYVKATSPSSEPGHMLIGGWQGGTLWNFFPPSNNKSLGTFKVQARDMDIRNIHVQNLLIDWEARNNYVNGVTFIRGTSDADIVPLDIQGYGNIVENIRGYPSNVYDFEVEGFGPINIDSAIQTTQINNGAGITATDNTITVDDASGFPSSGRITIDNETMYYTDRSRTQLYFCRRGFEGTDATTHADNAVVILPVQSAAMKSIGIGIGQTRYRRTFPGDIEGAPVWHKDGKNMMFEGLYGVGNISGRPLGTRNLVGRNLNNNPASSVSLSTTSGGTVMVTFPSKDAKSEVRGADKKIVINTVTTSTSLGQGGSTWTGGIAYRYAIAPKGRYTGSMNHGTEKATSVTPVNATDEVRIQLANASLSESDDDYIYGYTLFRRAYTSASVDPYYTARYDILPSSPWPHGYDGPVLHDCGNVLEYEHTAGTPLLGLRGYPTGTLAVNSGTVSLTANQHTGADNQATVFTAAGGDFVKDGVQVGYKVTNTSDSNSVGVVTAVTKTTITVGGGLTGGSQNDFDLNDTITVTKQWGGGTGGSDLPDESGYEPDTNYMVFLGNFRPMAGGTWTPGSYKIEKGVWGFVVTFENAPVTQPGLFDWIIFR